MKKLIIALALVLVMLVGVGTPVLAAGGEDVEVTCSGIVVTGDPWVGGILTVSGTVTIVANANASPNTWQWGYAAASSSAYYGITDPNGNTTASGSNSESDFSLGFNPPGPANFPADADASQTFSWSQTFQPGTPGSWVFAEGGAADAAWATYFLFWQTGGGSDSASGELSSSIWVRVYPFETFCITLNEPYNFWRVLYFSGIGTLAEDMCLSWDGYELCIPHGTIITGADGRFLLGLHLDTDGASLVFSPDTVYFSQPVTLTKRVGGFYGETVEVMTFSAVINGIPVPD